MTTKEEDIAYYRRRIDACAEQALRAETPSARAAHEAMARLYRDKLVALGDTATVSGQNVAAPDAIPRTAPTAAAGKSPHEL